MNKYLALLIVILFSCSTNQSVNQKNTSYKTIYKNSNGGSENSGYLHITNNEDYIKLIETLNIDESEFNQLVTVNFKENDVVVIYQGQKTSGGYGIDVASISWENDTLLIKKIEIVPNKGEMATMALTSPYCITIIPKAKKTAIIQ